MNFEDLFVEMSNAPTIMGRGEMVGFINELMRLERRENCLEDICRAVEILAESYGAGTYFEVSRENESILVEFSQWLSALSDLREASEWHRAELSSLATVFLMFPGNVYRNLK